MKTPTEILAVKMLRQHINAAASTLEILEEVEGADRRMVAPPRRGGQTDEGEQRSVDGCAVAAVEAEEILHKIYAIADAKTKRAEVFFDMDEPSIARSTMGEAVGMRAAAEIISRYFTKTPKPESGADEPEKEVSRTKDGAPENNQKPQNEA